MATTFTSNYQIKLIGTGLESGTWGTSANENLERIEQALGGSASVLVTGLADYAAGPPASATWKTEDTAAAGATGSEGRCGFVVFTSGTDVGSAGVVVRVRGSTSSIYPDRIFIAKNSLGSGRDLKLNCNSTDGTNTLTVSNGAYALVYTDTSDNSVNNALATLQVDSLTFPAAADISILDNNAASLDITEGANSYLKFNTTDSSEAVVVGKTLDIDTATIDVKTQATTLSLKENADAALDIKEDDQSYIECDTQTSGPQVLIGGGAEVVTLNIDTATIDVATQATDFLLKTNDAAALEVYETTSGGTKMLAFDTTTPKVIVPVELEVTGTLDVDGTSDFSATSNFSATATFSGVDINGGNIDGTVIGDGTPAAGDFTTVDATSTITATTILTAADISITGTDGYIAFDTIEATPADGYGFRDNSGKVEAKSDGGAWGGLYSANQVSGDGTYELVTIVNPFQGTSNYSNTHSLGATPRIVVFYTECIDASGSFSYVQGDRIHIGDYFHSYGFWYNSTSVGFAFRNQAALTSKTTNTWSYYSGTGASGRWKLCAHLWL